MKNNNKKNNEKQIIISIDTEKAFDGILHCFMIKNKNKTISKQGTEGTFLDLTYSIYEKPTANSIPRTYWGKTESFLPKNMNKTRMLALTVSIQHYTGGSSQKFDFSKNH